MSIRTRLERLEKAVKVPDVLEVDVRYYDEVTGEISPPGKPEQIRPDLIVRWPDVD